MGRTGEKLESYGENLTVPKKKSREKKGRVRWIAREKIQIVERRTYRGEGE